MHWKLEGTWKAEDAECLTMCNEESGKEREDKQLYGLKRRRGEAYRENNTSVPESSTQLRQRHRVVCADLHGW
eukprot:3941361-Rhodomonas_salina.5